MRGEPLSDTQPTVGNKWTKSNGFCKTSSPTWEMHLLFVSIICGLTIVPSSERQARPLGMGSDINDREPCQRSTIADTASLHPHPLKGTSFFALLLLSLQERAKVRGGGKYHYKRKFLTIGQNIHPPSPPLPPLPCSLLPILPFSRIAESQPTVLISESNLGHGCCKTLHAQPLMNMYKPWKASLHCPFTRLLT